MKYLITILCIAIILLGWIIFKNVQDPLNQIQPICVGGTATLNAKQRTAIYMNQNNGPWLAQHHILNFSNASQGEVDILMKNLQYAEWRKQHPTNIYPIGVCEAIQEHIRQKVTK